MKNYDYIGQISNELKEIFGKELNVSKETIYIYVFCKGELKKVLRFHKKSKFPRGKNHKFMIYEVFQSTLKKIVSYLGRRFNYEKIKLPFW